MKTTEYLGDGLYAHFDGYGIELRANSHITPTDKVYIEPSVMVQLQSFWEQAQRGVLKPEPQGGL